MPKTNLLSRIVPTIVRVAGTIACTMLLELVVPSAIHAQRDTASMRAEILAVEHAWNDAIVRKDTAFVRALLTDDFMYVAPNGYQARRDELLRVIADTGTTLEPMLTRDVTVRRYGDAVIVTGWFRQAGASAGVRFETFMRYTDVYVCDGRRWRAASAHASALARAPGA